MNMHISVVMERSGLHALSNAFGRLELHTDNHQYTSDGETAGVIHRWTVCRDTSIGTTTRLKQVSRDGRAKEVSRAQASDK